MDKVLSVSQVNSYIKSLISGDMILSNLWIQGELSNFKLHYSGHMYFTLKDSNSVIKCVMFASRSGKLRFNPEDGMKVLAKGSISVYERDGQYQFYVEDIQPDGAGALFVAFEQLKKRLEAEGLFDINRKKKLPMLPSVIGVVTSKTGSVIRDILNVTYRRFPDMKVQIYPVAVQGEGAGRQIAKTIDFISREKCCDVIILARGGGSIEELWAFNEEITARAIAASTVPVVSAVGHETDFVISDFIADLRAPTPSAAAELVVPDKAALLLYLLDLSNGIKSIPLNNLKIKRAELNVLKANHIFKRPYDRILSERLNISQKMDKLTYLIELYKDKNKSRVALACAKLNGLSPLAILARGYSVAETINGTIISSVDDISTGDIIKVIVSNGTIRAKVQGGVSFETDR